ncbi:MAG: hypothetical protein HDR02_15185 [Lachnospiraceae bacterium]|nr:hypothetical protein [Lachnospiraceae bacterium]
MPRVAINKKTYMLRDLAEWIEGRMSTKGLRQEDVAQWININQQSMSRRLKQAREGKDAFKVGELFTLLKNLDATDEEILRLTKM